MYKFKSIFLATLSLTCGTLPLCAQAVAPAEKEAENAEKAEPAKVVRAMKLLNSQSTLVYNAETKQLLDEIKAMGDVLRNLAKNNPKTDLTGKVRVTFYTDKAPLFEVESLPKMEAEKEAELRKELAKVVKSKMFYFDSTFVIYFQLGNGDPAGRKLKPELSAQQSRLAALQKADLVESNKIIQDYARQIALPVTRAVLLETDPKFVGVRGMGDSLKGLDFTKPLDVEALTDQNALYWRGILEMKRNNNLVSSTRILLHTANGNFDHASKYLSIQTIFADKEAMSTEILNNLKEMFQIQDAKVQAVISKGIKLHDQQKFDEAVKVYSDLLEKYPYSAHGTYEKWFAANTKKLFADKGKKAQKNEGLGEDKDFASWQAARKEIYAIDPLYELDVRAKSPREQFMLMRRMEMKFLLAKPMNAQSLIEYADIARDLGVYPFAAELYFVIASNIAKENHGDRNIVELYYYCAHQAGAKDIAKLYKGDMAEVIKKYDTNLEDRINKKKTKEE